MPVQTSLPTADDAAAGGAGEAFAADGDGVLQPQGGVVGERSAGGRRAVGGAEAAAVPHDQRAAGDRRAARVAVARDQHRLAAAAAGEVARAGDRAVEQGCARMFAVLTDRLWPLRSMAPPTVNVPDCICPKAASAENCTFRPKLLSTLAR